MYLFPLLLRRGLGRGGLASTLYFSPLRRDVLLGQRGGMKRIIPEPFLTFSRNLRAHQTPWETKLWQHLRAGRFYGLKFKRQVQMGQYIVDFSCREKKLIIELDGSQHNSEVGKLEDYAKKDFLGKEGYKVLHFWNNDLDNTMEGVLENIRRAVFK